MQVNGSKIDTLAEETLRELYNSDAESMNTVDVRDRLQIYGGDIEVGDREKANSRVKRRFDRLEEAGAITQEDGGVDDNGEHQPREASITSKGRELVERYKLTEGVSEDEETLPEKVNRLERENARFEKELKEYIKSLQEEVDSELHRLDSLLQIYTREGGTKVQEEYHRDPDEELFEGYEG